MSMWKVLGNNALWICFSPVFIKKSGKCIPPGDSQYVLPY